jgi:hypothetical protein
LTAPTYGASYGEGKVQGVVKAAQTGILWSQVQVLVGPPKVKKPLTEISGFFRLMNCSLIIGRSVSECKERNLESFRPMKNQVTPDELVE